MGDFLARGTLAAIRAADTLNLYVGRASAWLVLACVFVCAATALLRYVLGVGWIWMQDAYILAYGAGFMLMAGYTYLTDQHVRVDIWYGKLGPRGKAWVELLGILLMLFPWLLVTAVYSGPFIAGAWAIREGAAQPGGLPGVYLYKTVIWVFCALLGIQGLAALARSVLVLSGHPAGEVPRPEAATEAGPASPLPPAILPSATGKA
jgi:TRAP-type mannitol/chloroaromatic compound transport system permease small subunit